LTHLPPSDIPSVGQHRRVDLHNFQDDARLDVVRREIDLVFDRISGDIPALVRYCNDGKRPPEARLLAYHLVVAHRAVAADSRQERPSGFDIDDLAAVVCALGSRKWRSRRTYGAVFEDHEQVPRPEPLPEGEGI
jgi:hypothetical protein